MNMIQHLPYVWPATAFITLCVGLAACGFNVLKVLQLGSLRRPLQYVAGLAGAISLLCWFTDRANPAVVFPGNPQFASYAWFITGLVALCVGLAACGCNVLAMVRLGGLRKPLQYAAAVVGAYVLLAHCGMV